MTLHAINRRTFIQHSLSTLAVAALHPHALGQSTIKKRLEWQDFKKTSAYPSFVNAIAKMRANKNASDPASWTYWANAHANYCPHGIAYFLAWHRGYLHLLEKRLQSVSGNASLMLPYWDYYKNPAIPAEFTAPGTSNPLYSERLTSNVRNALTLTPFLPTLTNFQRGQTFAYEPQLEYKPHGPIHNLLGKVMATPQAPADPIFWLHHAQIDRLWVAWVAAGNGRQMPPRTDAYWQGSLTYAADLRLPLSQVYDTNTVLNYGYADETLPSAIPSAPAAPSASIVLVSTHAALQNDGLQENALPQRPTTNPFTATGPKRIDAERKSIGGVKDIVLDEHPVSARIAVRKDDSRTLQAMAGNLSASPFGKAPAEVRGKPAQTAFRSVQVVLDDICVTSKGDQGGYFFDVYLNLPQGEDATAATPDRHLLGGFGVFEIKTMQHHAHAGEKRMLSFPATRLLPSTAENPLKDMTVSFICTRSEDAPRGPVVEIGELRVEFSTGDVE